MSDTNTEPTRYTYTRNERGNYVCQHCGDTKRLRSTMHYHLKKHEGKLPFECTFCHKGFLHASTLDLHMKAQHQKLQERLFQCPMAGCTYRGTLTKANMIIHYVRKHCKEEATVLMTETHGKSLICAHCEKECNSATAFNYHILVAGCLQVEDEERRAHIERFLMAPAPATA